MQRVVDDVLCLVRFCCHTHWSVYLLYVSVCVFFNFAWGFSNFSKIGVVTIRYLDASVDQTRTRWLIKLGHHYGLKYSWTSLQFLHMGF